IARRRSTAVLCLTHLNAAGQFLGRRVMEKVRTAIRMEHYDRDPKRRLEVVKTNAQMPAALGLTMGESGNEYDDQPPEPPEENGGRPAGRSARQRECDDWLKAELKTSPKRVSMTR